MIIHERSNKRRKKNLNSRNKTSYDYTYNVYQHQPKGRNAVKGKHLKARKRIKNKVKIILVIIVISAICFIINKKINDDKTKQIEEISASIENEESINIINEEENTNNTNETEEQNEIKTNNKENAIEIKEIPKKEVEASTTDWNLILINKKHELSSNYEVNLSKVEDEHRVDSRIAEALKNMLKDARQAGLNPKVCSSYRTREEQKQLHNDKIAQYVNQGYSKERAIDLASYWVTNPGTSEHEAGLAVDIISKTYEKLNKDQENTEVQKWLKENSYKYGYALRYPPEKSEITMINYEPWHYRYVGIENAKYMKEHDMCLEEYIDYLKQFENPEESS